MRNAIIIILILLILPAAVQADPDTSHPNPQLSPEQVVRAQLQALRNNDPHDNRGIAIAYRFASPGNKRATGGLAAFTRMMHAGFTDMLAQRSARVEVLEKGHDEAVLRATLDLPAGGTSRYLFLLRRIHGKPCDGCWMTDGVAPNPDNGPPLRSA